MHNDSYAILAEHLITNVHIICLQGLTRWQQIGTSSQRDVVEHLLYRVSVQRFRGYNNADMTEELICYPCHPRPSSPTLGAKNVTLHSDSKDDTG